MGFHVKRCKKSGKYITLTTVPDDKIGKFKRKIQKATSGKGAVYESVIHKLLALNRIINGWAEYYRYTNWKADDVPSRLDFHISNRMFRWAKRKHNLSISRVVAMYNHRQTGYRVDGTEVDRWNFGVKVKPTYVTDGYAIWLAKLSDKPSKRYRPKEKLNPFISYQYEFDEQSNILEMWEGKGNSPYISDEYWINKKRALKRDNYQCRLCGKRVTIGSDSHCHHIDGNSNNHVLDNLVTLCIECHYHTYNKEHEFTF